MSSLKESEEQTSPPPAPLSRGVHVASSHFSKMRASSGNKGCLEEEEEEDEEKDIRFYTVPELILPINYVFVPGRTSLAAAVVGLGVLVRCVCPSGQVDGLQRAGCGMGGAISVDSAHPVQAIVVRVFILEDRRTPDL